MTHSTLPPIDLDPQWFDAIPKRISSRRFDGEPLNAALLDRVERTCLRLAASCPRARPILVRQAPPEVFTGLVGSYGRIDGAPSLIALVGAEDPTYEIGRVGEASVLDATVAGAGTCWIAAAFDAERAGKVTDVGHGERVHAIVALGNPVSKVGTGERLARAALRARHRLSLDKIAEGHDQWPAWAQEAAKAVRLAPSGANRQPWRMRLEQDALVLTAVPSAYWTATVDLGIAMLHAELGAVHAGVCGEWAVSPNEIRFSPRPAA